MSFDEILDIQRAALPTCNAVAYGDYAARLILRASHDPRLRRENLDELCDHAADGFALLDAISASAPDATDQGDRTQTALLGSHGCTIFVRPESNASEFLSISCRQSTQMTELFRAAKATLDQLR